MWQCSASNNLNEGYINIWIDREFETNLSTMGSIFIHGRHLYTLEPPERNNVATNDYRTAGRVPCGSYSSFVRVSGINGWCIELKNVPGRSNIQIHKGNSYKDTTGCVLVGMSQDRNYVSDSKSAMEIIKMEVESSGRNPIISVNIYGMPQDLTEETEDTSPQPSSGGGW